MGKNKSPYDDSGMPLGTTTADYDNADDIRKNQVRSTYVEPIPLNAPDYQPKQLSKKLTGEDGRYITKKGFNSSLYESEVENFPTTETVDMEDPAERKKLLVTESVDKGFEETPELPKTEKKESVDSVKKDIDEDKGEDFLKTLEKESK